MDALIESMQKRDAKKNESLQWTGSNLLQMCAFMKQDIDATTPYGSMKAVTPYGEISAKPGQWVIKVGSKFQVVDNL